MPTRLLGMSLITMSLMLPMMSLKIKSEKVAVGQLGMVSKYSLKITKSLLYGDLMPIGDTPVQLNNTIILEHFQ